MRALLDVNVLIALFDADHIFNDRAHAWLESQAAEGIATCPLTENGLVRILTNPGYSKQIRLAPAEVIRRLKNFIAAQDHRFFEDRLSLADESIFRTDYILGSKQITDIYLLGLATAHEACLATFDESVNRKAVPAASPKNLFVIE
ncbi:TA system VapC family ribonuclease toxin [Coraliomargarita parva]|uniref:TA system VapC family ribonuclease toxin n=1 Tax=Coraliomargarita parva TaxID=3014050 RepID=UPI0022B31276|nr:TA system VapC family ribonuclease toxin [Coraliomargarita parva]